METKPEDLEGLATTSGNAVEAEAKETIPTSKPKDPAPPATEDVPDPDEDDLDDLDGLYFTPKNQPSVTLSGLYPNIQFRHAR